LPLSGKSNRSLSCQAASSSLDSRDLWPAFLRSAYLVKAFREGRIPAHAVDQQSRS
jgi:hypothetical protein